MLKEVRLPKNTSTIQGALSSINNLELLDIGVATSIGVHLSGSMYTKMKYFIARNTSQVITPNSSTVFNSGSPIGQGEGMILVPRSMVDTYKSDSNWSGYAASIYAIEDYPEICG